LFLKAVVGCRRMMAKSMLSRMKIWCAMPLKTQYCNSGLLPRVDSQPTQPRHDTHAAHPRNDGDFKGRVGALPGTTNAHICFRSIIRISSDIFGWSHHASCTKIIMALGPATELDVPAGNNALAWVLATIGGGGWKGRDLKGGCNSS